MSCNIMIVDDSGSMRAVIKKIAAISGFNMDHCYEASNGREALEILKENWVDVIISDINMPEVNGLELLRSMQADDLYKEIPVIIITTEGSDERMQEALSHGAKGFIKKPFQPEELRSTLYEVLGMSKDGAYGQDEADMGGLDF
ncbi:MAG: response regulator [Desulfobacterales bacterium]|nr:response regulator [Desulfobacterales bacterium]MDD3949927.1 response regulator [Desulfobacterales bacterium]MDD4463575.1 response regulator [Desulfobacterales bacterium]MDY0378750.1 response regulator [Desulfobacterales bacterium]